MFKSIFMNEKICIKTFTNKGEVGGFYLAKGSNTMPLVYSELDTVMKKYSANLHMNGIIN